MKGDHRLGGHKLEGYMLGAHMRVLVFHMRVQGDYMRVQGDCMKGLGGYMRGARMMALHMKLAPRMMVAHRNQYHLMPL